jgi:hypothetical protein
MTANEWAAEGFLLAAATQEIDTAQPLGRCLAEWLAGNYPDASCDAVEVLVREQVSGPYDSADDWNAIEWYYRYQRSLAQEAVSTIDCPSCPAKAGAGCFRPIYKDAVLPLRWPCEQRTVAVQFSRLLNQAMLTKVIQ